ncbi:hypothetical protein ALC57_12145 [Trachymyrmex cornetzi]|uniref:Uncharacterized protein n=1 Tax=Trachymyrmex cornetzi TaxID=471704 RepID=A0A195DS62_9HYME|nr:hypothetical protein ALC57_12145 [Trachymyrmex cornetzi]
MPVTRKRSRRKGRRREIARGIEEDRGTAVLFPRVGSEPTSVEALSAKLYSAFPSLDECMQFLYGPITNPQNP